MKRTENYVAMIGDLIGSRQLPDRDEIQSRLVELLHAVNNRYSRSLAARFVITIGDEFQGLVRRDFPLYDFYRFFQHHFGTSIQTRFGIGLGPLTTSIREEALGMDGPCFHHARLALETARTRQKKIVFQGFELNTSLNVVIDFIHALESGWTARQREVVTLYLQENDQTRVAQLLDVSKQSVNKAIKAAKIDLIRKGWESVEELFSFTWPSPQLNQPE